MWPILLLILSPIFLFILILLILLPFHFAIYSLINVIATPFHLLKIALNKKLRNNHALEHATINILESKYGYRKLSGFAREDGFVIRGQIDPHHLQEASMLGLYQLQEGNSHLAIHTKCGTSILAANFSSAVIFLLLLWLTKSFTLFNIIIAIILAQFIGPITGRLFQKHITTSTDVNDMTITKVNFNQPFKSGFTNFPFFRLEGPVEYYVQTKRVKTIA